MSVSWWGLSLRCVRLQSHLQERSGGKFLCLNKDDWRLFDIAVDLKPCKPGLLPLPEQGVLCAAMRLQRAV